MLKTTRHVLKADEVAFDDPLHLGLDPAAPTHGADSRCVSSSPRVRIAENYPEYAVIEVTCTCGKTTYIRCEYPAASPLPTQPAPAQGPSA
jgi:hypothetical protein